MAALRDRGALVATVLLVEDEAALRHLLKRALLLFGFDVCEAAGGHEALALMEQVAPDVVVTDLVMPGMSGIALARAMAALSSLADVPVIIMSGTPNATIPIDYHVLEKPFPLRLLVDTVQDLLRP